MPLKDMSVRERLSHFFHRQQGKKTVPSLNILTHISLIDKSTLSTCVTMNWYEFIEVLLTLRIKGVLNVWLKNKSLFWFIFLEFCSVIAISEFQPVAICDTLLFRQIPCFQKRAYSAVEPRQPRGLMELTGNCAGSDAGPQ